MKKIKLKFFLSIFHVFFFFIWGFMLFSTLHFFVWKYWEVVQIVDIGNFNMKLSGRWFPQIVDIGTVGIYVQYI